MLVLAGALAANRRARIADAIVLKILGATRGRLTATFLIEYALLGATTVAFGVAAGALAAAWAVNHIMKFHFTFDWTSSFIAAAGGLAIMVGLGMIGAWRDVKPEAGGVPARIVTPKEINVRFDFMTSGNFHL